MLTIHKLSILIIGVAPSHPIRTKKNVEISKVEFNKFDQKQGNKRQIGMRDNVVMYMS
jgi:hypothetical protein